MAATILVVVGIFVVSTIVHELAHALAAFAQGYKLKRLYLGILLEPVIFGKKRSTAALKWSRNGVEYGISWIILGGMVDFHGLDEAPWWRMAIIALAGPVSNLLLAFGALVVFAEWSTAMTIVGIFIQGTLEGLMQLLRGDPATWAMVSLSASMNTMQTIVTTYPMGGLFLWSLVNVGLFVTNLLPIPALDGGQVFMSLLGDLLGEKYKPYLLRITLVTLYILCGLILLIFGKEIYLALKLLFGL